MGRASEPRISGGTDRMQRMRSKGMNVVNTEGYVERQLPAAPNLNLYYRVYGDTAETTPVVCLHGYWRTAKDFEELAAHLAPRRRVLTPDLRGRGRSGRSTDAADYGFERLAEDVIKLMDTEGVDRAVFVGVALGAQLIMDLGARSPERVAGIVFNDSAPETVAASGHRMAKFSGGDELSAEEAMARLKAQYEEAFPLLDEAAFQRLLYRNYRQTADGRYVRDFDQLTNEGLRRTARERPTFWAEYERLPDVPIAVLRGENSDFITPEIVERMIAGRRHARVHIIPNTGHPVMMWEPEAFAAIDDLLAKVDAAESRAA
jgi:pimeloyl-ACP methyl ester carboxylesterase